jgi:chaperone modulatory protein CbpM
VRYALVRAGRVSGRRRGSTRSEPGLDLDSFARLAGVHPDLVRRLVRLGLLDPANAPGGGWSFSARQLTELGRIERLHALGQLNYAAIGMVVDLLDRIAELEEALAAASAPTSGPGQVTPTGGRTWIRTD